MEGRGTLLKVGAVLLSLFLILTLARMRAIARRSKPAMAPGSVAGLSRRAVADGTRRVVGMLWIAGAFLLGFLRMGQAFRDWSQVEALLPEDKAFIRIAGQVADIRETGEYQKIVVKTEMMGQVLVYAEAGDIEWTPADGGSAAQGSAGQGFAGQGAVCAEKAREPLRIGETVTVEGKASRFKEARNPGQFDLEKYYRARQISTALFADRLERPEAGKGAFSPYLDGLYRIRSRCSQILTTICEEVDGQLFKAAILGEKEEMDETVKDLYQRSGIAHLLAISGLHLSMLGMGLHKLLRKAGAGYGTAALAGGAAVISYGLMTGASGSALRAAIMLSAAFLAAFLGRTYDLLSALSLAALLLAFSRPFLIADSGFLLSFGAVLGIGLLGDGLVRALKVGRTWQKDLLLSLSVQLMTAPVVLWNYFQYPAYGICLNLLVVPLMGYVILSGLLGIACGFFVPALGVAAVGSGHYILQCYQELCQLFLALPGSQILFGRPGWGQIASYYLVLAGTVLAIKSAARSKWVVLLAGSLGCFLCLCPPVQRGCSVTFLDVGQGDGIVIVSEGGCFQMAGLERAEACAGLKKTDMDLKKADAGLEKTGDPRRAVILVDGGSTSEKRLGEERLEPFLKSMGIGCIDAALVSHGDEDHISGLRYLLEECGQIQIRRIILPENGRGDTGYDRLILAAQARGTGIWYMDAGDQIQAGMVHIACLYPEKGEDIDPTDRNQQSMLLRVDHKDLHMLLTGDADQQGERRMVERQAEAGQQPGKDPYPEGAQKEAVPLSAVQVLKAAHHGSRYSNSQELLEAVSPALTVISYKAGNPYGHPHEEALERIEAAGGLILKTGEQGAVILRALDGELRYHTYLP